MFILLFSSGCRVWIDSIFFFFNDTATTEIYTLSLHDALPILVVLRRAHGPLELRARRHVPDVGVGRQQHLVVEEDVRSEEHTSELQSQSNLVCRLLLEKKKHKQHRQQYHHISLHTLQ